MRCRSSLVAAVLFTLAACGSSSGPGASGDSVVSRYGSGAKSDTTATAGAAGGYAVPPAAPATGAGVVAVAATSLGDVLVDGTGRTLYAFTKDAAGQPSACEAGCATAWPPVLADSPTAGSGADAAKLSVIARKDGAKQVAYDGHLLYTYATDRKAGDVTGQKVNGVWFVVAGTGALVTT